MDAGFPTRIHFGVGAAHGAVAPLSLLAKAREIARTHGVWHLLLRGATRVRRQVEERADAYAQRRAWEALLARIGQVDPVFFPRHSKPIISILIPVCNDVRLTSACLNALLHELGSIPVEVIVINVGSTDGTGQYLDSCSGVTAITHVASRGVAQSINHGAAVARGRYLHLLNNDTIVTPGWMSASLRAFESRDRVGAVGSQLRAPDGSISQAGGLVWKDGYTSNYGRGRQPSNAGVAFPREADYCSGASLMVRADLFREIGGFSDEFATQHFGDIDLCFRLRAAGYRVMYEPSSVAVHCDNHAVTTDPSDRNTFAKKWSGELAEHFPPDENLVERAARRLAGKRTALVIDSFIPFDDRSAGGRRLLAVMRLMRELDWHVVFVAHDGGDYEPYTSRVRAAGIEVIPHRGAASVSIEKIPFHIDLAWICRPDLMEKYLPLLRRRMTATVVYDTVDLHFLRRQREMGITGRSTDWEAVRDIELSLARRADSTVVTSDAERTLLAEYGIDAQVVPIVEDVTQTHKALLARRDVLFLGNYTHEPNVDAALRLVNEIMPRVWERVPTMNVIVAGAEPTPAIQRLAGERIRVTGHVPDVRPLFENARVFVAPLRYGAGMKGKIVQSLALGLPLVTTSIGAEGVGLVDGLSAIIADDDAAIAEAILHLHGDEAFWSAVASEGRKVAQRFTPAAVRPLVESALEVALEQQIQVGVNAGFTTHSA